MEIFNTEKTRGRQSCSAGNSADWYKVDDSEVNGENNQRSHGDFVPLPVTTSQPVSRCASHSKYYELTSPEPLFHFEDAQDDLELTVHTVNDEPLKHIDHLDVEMQPEPCHDPLYARRLSKWFIARAGKEAMYKQGEDFNYMRATQSGLTSQDTLMQSEEGGVVAEPVQKFCEFVVYTSEGGAINVDSKSLPAEENSYDGESVQESNDIISGQHDSTVTAATNAELTIDPSLTFDGKFESGNLGVSKRVYGRKKFMTPRMLDFLKDAAVPAEVDQEYDIILENDINTNGNIQWYYFSASCMSEEFMGVSFPLTVRFNLVNMQKSDALYNYGMRPLVYSTNKSADDNIGWMHDCHDICYYKNGRTEVKGGKKKRRVCSKYSLSFTYTFEKADKVYFAHSFPYTYTMLQTHLNGLSANEDLKRIFRRKQLCKTLLGNRCDLLTITAPAYDSHESRNRKAIIISARIHPGETNSSFMMQGIIDFLTSEEMEAKMLRQLFVFKIVPMLNPDGVIHGNYRCSIAGTDLNRRYADAHRILHPEVIALKELIKETQDHRGVLMYLDLHGHSRNKNAFFYGCDYFLQQKKMIEPYIKEDDRVCKKIFPRIFPKLLNLISSPKNGGYFEFQDCSFKVQKSKQGTGRVISWLKLGITAAYTVELSFCGSGNNKESRILKNAFKNDKSGMCMDVIGNADYYPPLVSTTSRDYSSNDDLKSMVNDGGDEAEDDKEVENENNNALPASANKSNELLDLIESYKTAVHYTQRDYKTMGRDLCLGLLHFTNITSMAQLEAYRLSLDTQQKPTQTNSNLRDGHKFLETLNKKTVEMLNDYDENAPLLTPTIYTADAIKCVLNASAKKHNLTVESITDLGTSFNHGSDNRSPNFLRTQEPAYGYRVHTEIILRKMLHLEDEDLVVDGIEEEEIVMDDADNDAGSDSDPSVDNVPVDTVLKKGKLGSRAMNLMSPDRATSRKKYRRSSSLTKSKSTTVIKPPVDKEAPPTQTRRRLPPRASITYDRRRRDQKLDQHISVLSSGSSQRYLPSLHTEDYDNTAPSKLKIQSIVFPPDEALLSLSSRVNDVKRDERHRGIQNELDDKTKRDAGYTTQRESQTFQREDSASSKNMMIHTNDKEVSFTLQAFSDRYRMRGAQVHRSAGLSSLEAPRQVLSGSNVNFRPGHHFDGASGNIDVGTCRSISALSENIRNELDSLALGMRASGGGKHNR